ncbi:hypothetical protein M413DRAFT_449576 [Hebeloma cylindrosporum]|uniref:F-box domain-containing protein n=1 Tax=Hebeloma cylindrosporum TaxID=76867 RepID=A0A0C3BWT2_HEBCY|nr:hypothetical protein M413DRAFT_449576 [Hebeloma cylindrosporum h7]
MSLFLQLPQEIIDVLVDYLHETEGRQQTRVCSLIHRSFTYRAHYYLFSTIQFSSDNSPVGRGKSQRICLLNEILHRKPYIAGLVRDIHLCLTPSDSRWITEDSEVLETMRLLIKLGCAPRKCVIEKHRYAWRPQIYNPRVFMEVFVQEIVAPTVTHLEIRGLHGVPADFPSSFANLNTLVVEDVAFDAPVLQIPPTSSPRILDLDLRDLDRVPEISGLPITRGIYDLDLTHLQRLKVSLWFKMMHRLVTGLFSLAAAHLQSLSLLYVDEYITTMDISQLKRLRVLELHFNTHRDFPVQLSDVIHSMSCSGVLEEVKVEVTVGFDSWKSFISRLDGWAQLDASLCIISSGREFRYTCLFRYPCREGEFEERRSELLDLIQWNLPLSFATPKLSMYHNLTSY